MWLSVNNESVLDNSNPLRRPGGDSYCQRCGIDGTVNDDIGYRGLGDDVCLIGPDGCQLGWRAANTEITANTEWLDDNPAARRLFEVFKPPLIDLAVAGVDLANSDGAQADVVRIAAEWIANNRDLAESWVVAARDASAP